MSAPPAPDGELSTRKILVGATCLLGSTFVPYVQATIGPLMMLPMITEFGWTRTEFAFASTFLFVFGSVTVLVFGRVADRFGPRMILLAGAVGGGLTMLLLSRQDTHLWRLYLAYALLGAFGSSGLGYTKIIGSLFTRHRGKALAIFGAESTVALAMLPLLTNALNVGLGWRRTYVVYAAIMFVMTPLLFLMIRGAGLSVPASRPGAAGMPATMAAEGLAPAQVRRDGRFWLIVLSAVLGSGVNAGLLAHIIPALTDKGFTPTVAAGVLSAAMFAGLAGTLVAGFAMDHFRSARVMSFFASASGVGCAVLALASAAVGGLPLVVAGFALQRAALAGMLPGTTYVLTRFVGMRSFGEAFAMQVVVQGLAMGAAPPLFGVLFERSGSYAPMYGIVVACAFAGAAIYPLLGPYRFGSRSGQQAVTAKAA